jgi:hypothetical protein
LRLRHPICPAAGAALVAVGVGINNGNMSAVALCLLVVGTGALVLSLRHGACSLGSTGGAMRAILLVEVLFLFWNIRPFVSGALGDKAVYLALAMLVFSLVVVLGFDQLSPDPRWGRSGFRCLLAGHVLLGVAFIAGLGEPFIDVFVFHRDALAAVLGGQNPYTITFPEISGDPDFFYGPGVARDGVLEFGYPYPPDNLLFVLPGHLFGDVRYALLVLSVASGWLLSRLGVNGRTGAVLYLFTPTFFRVIVGSWTETILVFGFALVMYAAVHRDRLAPWTFGLFGAIKQYTVVFAPLYLLLVPRPWRPGIVVTAALKALAVVAVLTLPFALIDVGAFTWSVVELQTIQPFRPDALSLLAASVNATGWPPTASFGWLPVVAALIAIGWTLRRAPTGAYGFSLATSIVMLALVLFSKQAFANYYFFATSAAFAAVASWSEPRAGEPSRLPT